MMAESKRTEPVGSAPAQDSGVKIKSPITSKEAEEQGIPARTPPPPPETCKYCGGALYYEGIVLPLTGRRPEVVFWSPTPRRCSCDKATAFWVKHDAEEERKRLEEQVTEENRHRQKKIERLLGKSGIKKRFQQRTFDRFIADTAERRRCLRTAKEYADRFAEKLVSGDGLYIEGPNGTGKTHLAAAIALQLIASGVPVVCKTAGDLLADVKNAFDNGAVSEAVILRAYKDADLLVIDDLGKEMCTDWSMSTLYAILNDRYEDLKPTIITTNYGADDLIAALTPKGNDGAKAKAIVSRLRENAQVVTMDWEDYRAKGGTT